MPTIILIRNDMPTPPSALRIVKRQSNAHQILSVRAQVAGSSVMAGLHRLTVKLSGHVRAADWSRGRTLLFRARGDTDDLHGPLQRLLGAGISQKIRRKPLHDTWHRQLKAPWNVKTDESAPDCPVILKIVRGTARD